MPDNQPITSAIPLLGFCAYSGTGKTTLIKQIIPLLKNHGLQVAVIKHAHHDFDLDQPGKDSYELRKAGADKTIICSHTRMVQITEFEKPLDEPSLEDIVSQFRAGDYDLILVEGYKTAKIPKIELHRQALGKPLMFNDDDTIIALACDQCQDHDHPITCLNISEPQEVADFIVGLLTTEKLVAEAGEDAITAVQA